MSGKESTPRAGGPTGGEAAHATCRPGHRPPPCCCPAAPSLQGRLQRPGPPRPRKACTCERCRQPPAGGATRRAWSKAGLSPSLKLGPGLAPRQWLVLPAEPAACRLAMPGPRWGERGGAGSSKQWHGLPSCGYFEKAKLKAKQTCFPNFEEAGLALWCICVCHPMPHCPASF